VAFKIGGSELLVKYSHIIFINYEYIIEKILNALCDICISSRVGPQRNEN
jgi:hypothetical protein